MKFLVTGGSGFLGGYLIDRLLQEGHRVVSIGRSDNNRPAKAKDYTFIKADIIDQLSLERVKKLEPDIEAIVHMAALVPKSKSDDMAQTMFAVNVGGTVNLLETFGGQIRNFVYASTAEVYGLPNNHRLISEAVLPVPQSYYGASKLAGEFFCQAYSKRHNLPTSMLRFTVLYGPGDRINRAIPNFINSVLAGEEPVVFGGEELRDYLHITDAAEALYLAAIKPVNGVFNIGTGKGISVRDTAKAVIAAADSRMSIKLKPREKPAADIVLDVGRAKRELGFEPRHVFPEMLEEQVAWQRQQS